MDAAIFIPSKALGLDIVVLARTIEKAISMVRLILIFFSKDPIRTPIRHRGAGCKLGRGIVKNDEESFKVLVRSSGCVNIDGYSSLISTRRILLFIRSCTMAHL